MRSSLRIRIAQHRTSTVAEAMPNGTLMRKHHCHDRLSVRSPPSSKPTGGAQEAEKEKMVCAIPICAGGNVDVKTVLAVESMPPAKAPWKMRNRTSSSTLVAVAHRNDNAVKPAIATMNVSRRPKRSASQGVSGMMTTFAIR